MLDHNNLEEYVDAVDYDQQDQSDTGVAFYTALAEETGGPILEIACGTGRISIPIAQKGYDVTGLDIVPGMLAQAQRKSVGLNTTWVVGDARRFALNKQFHLIFLTGNAFQAFLTRTDQEAMLRCIHAHLQDDGLVAFETRNPRWVTSSLDQQVSEEGLFTLLETNDEPIAGATHVNAKGALVQSYRTQVYDHVTQVLHWTTHRYWQEDGQEQTKVTRIAVRFTFPQELTALLHYNGFSVERQYGDWTLEPLTASSPSIISVCRKLTYTSDKNK